MSHKGNYSGLEFCPKCGVKSLEFDRYRAPNYDKAEYLCGTCGFGFRIGDSSRVAMARRLFKEHRQMRVGKFHEGVESQVADAFIKFTEKEHQRWQSRVDKRGTEL